MTAIARWFAPPVFAGDEEKTRQARLVNMIGIASIAFILIVVAGAVLDGNTSAGTLIMDFLGSAVTLQFLRWLRSGRVTLAGAGMVIFGFVYITGVTASTGSIRTPTAAIFVFWVLMTGLLFDLRGILIGTIAASLAVWGLIVAENAGWLRQPFHGVGVTQWITFTALFGFTSGLTYYVIQGTKRALSRAEQEIEERKQAQQALSKSKQQYDDLVSKIPFGTYILSSKQDGSFELDYVSPRAAELFNASVPSLLADAKIVFQTIHPDDRDSFIKLNQEGIEQLRPFEWSGRTRSEGKVKFLHIGSSPEPQENGEVLWHGIVEDITERKRLEKEKEEYFRFFRLSTDAMCIADPFGRFKQVNPALIQLTGYSEGELVSKPFLDFVHPEDRQRTAEEMEQQVQIRPSIQFENRYVCKDGAVILLSWTAFFDKNDGITYATARDITERKQLEEKVRQLAFYDVLTNLPNRRLMIDRLEQAMSASKRTGRYGALMFLDLDNFKPLNDVHGHEAGDLLLIEVARRLTSSVREIDTVSRFGGDEFAVLLSDLVADKAESRKEVEIIAEKIRVKLAEPYLLAIRGESNTVSTVEHRCSASIGADLFINQEFNQGDILRRADAAMYQAKAAGRNTVVIQDVSRAV